MTDSNRDILLARIDERVTALYDERSKYATCERVDAVADRADHAYNKIADHIKGHESMAVNRNLIVGSYVSGIAALGAALVAIFKK